MEPGFDPQVRAATLHNYADVAQSVGLDAMHMLQLNQIHPADIADIDSKLPAGAVVKLYEDSAAAAGREDFGLLMAECRNYASLGPIGLLLKLQPTVRAIVERSIANIRLLNDIIEAYLEDDGGVAMIRFELLPGYGSRQTIEAAVAIACRTYGELAIGWHPERIHFRHSAPANLATHRRMFRCPIEFDSEFDGIVCSSASLDVPNPEGDPELAAHAQRYIDLLSQQGPSNPVTGQARQAIFLLISSGNATMEKVACNLAIHPRSLQRCLNQEQTHFGALLSEVRRELALRYLNSSKQSVTDIALLLGYSTPSSFTRWFTDEFGKSPAAWRKTPSQNDQAFITAKAA